MYIICKICWCYWWYTCKVCRWYISGKLKCGEGTIKEKDDIFGGFKSHCVASARKFSFKITMYIHIRVIEQSRLNETSECRQLIWLSKVAKRKAICLKFSLTLFVIITKLILGVVCRKKITKNQLNNA